MHFSPARALRAPRHWPPGRGRAHRDRAPGSTAGRSPRFPKRSKRRTAKSRDAHRAIRAAMSVKNGAHLGRQRLACIGWRALGRSSSAAPAASPAAAFAHASRQQRDRRRERLAKRTARPGCRRTPAAGTARPSRRVIGRLRRLQHGRAHRIAGQHRLAGMRPPASGKKPAGNGRHPRGKRRWRGPSRRSAHGSWSACLRRVAAKSGGSVG